VTKTVDEMLYVLIKVNAPTAVGSSDLLGCSVICVLDNHLYLKWYLVGRRTCTNGCPSVSAALAKYLDK